MSSNLPIRVLHVIPSLSKGGAERLCLDMIRCMQELQGVETYLVVLSSENAYSEEYQDITPQVINAYVIPSVTGIWKVCLREWDNLVREMRPNIIHSHLYEAEIVTRYNLIKGVRYFTHCHQNTPQLSPFRIFDLFSKTRLAQLYERHFLMKKYVLSKNQFLCISKNTLEYYHSILPKQISKNTHLLPNAIDVQQFIKKSSNAPVNGKTIKLVSIGRLDQNKNQQFLIHVVAELKNRSIPINLVLLGDGELKNELKNLSYNLKVENEIEFYGSQQNIERVLWEQHVYVHSAISEAFGLVFLEAMAAGLPIVTLNGGGNQELILENINGHLITTNSVARFADKILSICESNVHYERMSAAAKEFAKKFDIYPYCKKLVALYKVN